MNKTNLTTTLKRRNFLISTAVSSLMLGTGLGTAHAAFAPLNRRILVHINLKGGPDFRHVFPPAFSTTTSSYGHQFWKSRASSYTIDQSNAASNAHWRDKFDQRAAGGVEFGILKQAGWLTQRWDQGQLAIVNNMVGAQTRDHRHCIMVMEQGNLSSGPNDFNRSGWGGRLASAANKNAVSLTPITSRFCYGAHPSGDINLYDNANVINARDTRLFSLYEDSGDDRSLRDTRDQMARSVKAYYNALDQTMSESSLFRRFVDHDATLREFGAQLDQRLASLPLPASLTSLYDRNGSNPLNNPRFGMQVSNLYDALAASDIFDMAVASMEYGGWDSHQAQVAHIEPKLFDIFGLNRALHTLSDSLPSDVKRNVVFVVSGEFGRQLVANGGSGTDHGRGNSMLVIGERVRGGVYGDMFPEQELARLGDRGPDINGLTAIDRLFGQVCNAVQSGSAQQVFPNINNTTIEPGLGLGDLFV